MPGSNRFSLRAIVCLSAITCVLAGCSSSSGVSGSGMPLVATDAHAARLDGVDARNAKKTQELYLGNILGGVLLYSTGKSPQQVGDITNSLPRVTSVWVDHTGVLYAFNDNGQYPYETVEEFQPGATSPFFSLTLQRYGTLVAADSKQNVYAQGENPSGQQVIDVYPPGSQQFANEYVVPSIGRESAIEGIAFDSTGTLLVGVDAFAQNREGQVGAVFRLDAASSTFVNLNLKKAFGGLIATDHAGNLYVGGGNRVAVYAPGKTKPSRVVQAIDTIVTLAVASNGALYVSTYRGGISVYPPGASSPEETFTPEAQVSGMALGPG